MPLASLRIAAVASSALGFMGFHRLREALGGASDIRARAHLARWSRLALRGLGVSARRVGLPPEDPCVFVANHRSYLDILVLAGHLGADATFLSRHDVGDWPVVGRAARDTGVVFVDRDDPQHRARAARELERALGALSLVVFPEGTTNGDPLPGRFEAGVFRLLARVSLPVVPLTLRYSRREAYWVDDTSVGEHLRTRVARGPTLGVEVRVGEVLRPAAFEHAAGLRSAVHAAVSAPIAEEGELLSEG